VFDDEDQPPPGARAQHPAPSALLTVPPLLAKDDAGQDTPIDEAPAPADDYARSEGSEQHQQDVLEQQAALTEQIETARVATANQWISGDPGNVLGRIGLTTSAGADTTTAPTESAAPTPLAFNPPAETVTTPEQDAPSPEAGTPNPQRTGTVTQAATATPVPSEQAAPTAAPTPS
jgi:hypothetical protein